MTTLMEEEPYAAVVYDSFISATCSKCFKKENLSRCRGCRFIFYCSNECQKGDWKDHKEECKFLLSMERRPSDRVRYITRILCKSKKDPNFKAFNGRTYDSLLDHLDDFKKSPNFEVAFGSLCREVREFMGDEAPEDQKILQAIGKAAINELTIFNATPTQEKIGIGLYIGLSVHDHSCDAKCFTVSNGNKTALRTLKTDAQYSKDLTISYLSGSNPMDAADRRESLLSGYCFKCNCPECLNVELNNRRTSGRSGCCADGWFAPTQPTCSSCGKAVNAERIKELKNANTALKEQTSYFTKEILLNWDPTSKRDVYLRTIQLFEESKKNCTDYNVNLQRLAETLLNLAFSNVSYRVRHNLNAGKKHANDLRRLHELFEFCLPYVRSLPPSIFTVEILDLRFRATQFGGDPVDIIEYGNELWKMTKLVFGDDNETTLFLKHKMKMSS